jgi:hypothetical protein
MAGLFSLAAQRAMEMSERKPDPVRIQAGPFNIAIPMDGGLSSLEKNISIKGQPHELSYITPGEGGLLQRLGGSGRMVNGIPAYYMGTGPEGSEDGPDEAVDEGEPTGPPDPDDRGPLGDFFDMGPISKAYMGTPDDPQSALNKSTTTSWLNTFLSLLANKVAAVTPFGIIPNLVAHLTTGRSIGELATGEKDPTQLGTETIAGWLGGKSRSEYDHMDPDEMSTDVHGVDQPSFDEDTMSEEDFPLAEQKAEDDDDTEYKALITNLFDNEEEADEENWFQNLTPEYQRILRDMYGDDVDQTGLPDILEQSYGRRGSV